MMYKGHCETFAQGARVLAARHMRFDPMNGTDHRLAQEQSRGKRAHNATNTHARMQTIVCSWLRASRGYADVQWT